MTDDYRPCICGAIAEARRTKARFAVCLCGATLSILPDGAEWYVQHGPNPEHRSPNYSGDNLLAVCDWVDSVCLGDRGADTEARP